ncbi:hypothetical protein PLESTB_000193600 [Pleodorina starrii]|uniref:DUF1802 family protein n=1 Tax=Pleodorina starrii TaxID=330485 RepID=A0A9W6BBX5_9CHLO|nr:hypothetical protein PLESTM_000337700 [Pleodorina starrii]GLC49203.1 hypothetical protein PLESTB_000193600 [Pleodorina starrii]GLC73542.1 hypothetical protein PLESTF_001389200 [Pleodorina starrii]
MQTIGKPWLSTPKRLPSADKAGVVVARPGNVSRRAVADLETPTMSPESGIRVRKALKEWAPTIEAIGHGEQTVLFRKGGIKEPTFRPEATTFLLFPTSFHTDQQLLKPGVAERYTQAMKLEPKSESVLCLPYVAQVTGAWTTYDPQVLPVLDEFHVWTEQLLDARLKWRPKQPITVMELRCWALRSPLELPVNESLFGCFSWVDVAQQLRREAGLDLDLDLGGAAPVVGDSDFAARQQRLRAALRRIQAEPLSLPLD